MKTCPILKAGTMSRAFYKLASFIQDTYESEATFPLDKYSECMGDKCTWWDEGSKRCIMWSIYWKGQL